MACVGDPYRECPRGPKDQKGGVYASVIMLLVWMDPIPKTLVGPAEERQVSGSGEGRARSGSEHRDKVLYLRPSDMVVVVVGWVSEKMDP